MGGVSVMDDAKWKAEMDAGTLKDAEIIKGDASRLAAAKGAAERLLTQEQEDVRAMRKVAGVGTSGAAPSKRKAPARTEDMLGEVYS